MMEQKRLGDIATYINGFAFKPEDRSTVGLPIIRIQDLTGNTYDLGFYDGSYPKRIEINDGDVLISWSASLGIYVWNRGKALLNQHIFKVAFDKCDVNREFFVYAVRHKLKEMESKTHGATMKHIVKKDFDNTLIPFPTLNEQGKIAKLLDTVDTIISARQQQLQKLDELVKARFVEMFGDPIYNTNNLRIKKLNSLGDWASGGTPTRTVFEYFDGDIDWYSAGELNTLFLNGSAEKITEEAIEKSTAKLFKAGSMLIGMYDTAAFKMGILKKDSASNQACACITPNDEINIIWLYYELQLMKDHFLSQRRGVRQKNLNLGMIKNFEIPIANKNQQDEFASFVTVVNKSKF